MDSRTKDVFLRLFLGLADIIFSIIFLIGLVGVIFYQKECELDDYLITLICGLLTIIFTFFAVLKSKNIKLKWLFLTKTTKEDLKKSLKVFENASDEFIKDFVKSRKYVYRRNGVLFQKQPNNWLFKDYKNNEKILSVYTMLYDSILSKGGFVEFCEKLEKRQDKQDYDSDSYEGKWTIKCYFTNEIISNELNFLIDKIYSLCSFDLVDNGISEEFTEKNEVLKKKLTDEYSPILFGFEEELKNFIDKNTTIQKENTHTMRLAEIYFNLIEVESKTYEIRLNDEKRRKIKIGDIIEFVNDVSPNEKIDVIVKELVHFKSFKQMLMFLSAKDIGFERVSDEKIIETYHKFYSISDELKFGVLAIKIKLKK